MVIEHFTHGPQPVYERAARAGRMLPEGLVYVDSWVDERERWYLDLGIRPENLRRYEHPIEKLSHYRKPRASSLGFSFAADSGVSHGPRPYQN